MEMKKASLFVLGALILTQAMTSVHAADPDQSKNVDSNNYESDQDGTIYGTLSGRELKQLKVTVPIKLEFAVVRDSGETTDLAPTKANNFVMGDYKLKVASDSEIGVKVANINLEAVPATNWSLATKADVAALAVAKPADYTSKEENGKLVISGISNADLAELTKKQKTISLSLDKTQDMILGDNVPTKEIFAGIGDQKSLGLEGTAGKVWIDPNLNGTSELAFKVVYTLVQQEKATPVAP